MRFAVPHTICMAWTDCRINAPTRVFSSCYYATAAWLPGVLTKQVQNCRKGDAALSIALAEVQIQTYSPSQTCAVGEQERCSYWC
jgi:hypothetical protein